MPVTGDSSPATLPVSERTRGDGLDAGGRPSGLVGGGRERAAAVLGGDDVVGVDLLLDRRLGRAAQAGAERGDDGDQREADHQRRGRGGRAAGVAERVLAGEPAGGAAEAAAGSPTTDASGLTSRGASMAMPTNSAEHADDERQRDHRRRRTGRAAIRRERRRR